MKDIVLKPTELADVYALRTLYDYVKGKCTQLNFEFEHDCDFITGSSTIIGDAPKVKKALRTDEVITVHSDITSRSRYRQNLDIDISVLKNAVKPMAQDDKLALRQKYGIFTEKPVVVVSYSEGDNLEIQLIHKIKESARIYLVGFESATSLHLHDLQYRHNHPRKNLKPLDEHPITCITERGVLKDYYAMADVAINCVNLCRTYGQMHNFVEATEGGPLFMVKPRESKQFGYTELARTKVIKACRNFHELLDQVSHYITNFEGNKEHCEKRSRQLEKNRKTYLPLLLEYINHAFLDAPVPADALPETEKPLLRAFWRRGVQDSIVHLRHPKTDWLRDFDW